MELTLQFQIASKGLLTIIQLKYFLALSSVNRVFLFYLELSPFPPIFRVFQRISVFLIEDMPGIFSQAQIAMKT